MESLFVAIKLGASPRLIKLVRNTQVLLRKERIKWIPDMELHVKLATINSLGLDKVRTIKDRLNEVVGEMSSFETVIRGFGNLGSHTFWAGVEQTPEFVVLREKINAALAEFKEPDQVDFVPNVLLGKINSLSDKRTFFKIIDANRGADLDELEVKEISLVSSELKSYGPVLSVVDRVLLKEPELEEVI